MKALVCNEYGPPDSLDIEERDDPTPGAGEVLIDVAATGLNFPDVLVIAGQYQVKTPPPFVPGNEAAGTVAATGDGVTRYEVGDRVIASTIGGMFAEKAVVPESRVIPLPDAFDFVQGAGFTVTYGTSYHALRQSGRLQEGETLLVLGAAGGVGIAAVEIGKAMGARVIAAASTDEKLEFAKAAGADETVNYSTENLNDAIKSLTDGNGVDVVYDPVGGDLAQLALRATAWHGRYLVVGFASGDIPAFPANLALLKEASIVGVWWGTWTAKNPAGHIKNMAELQALIAAGKISAAVTEVFDFDDYAAAFSCITERRAKGKVVLKLA